MSPELIEFLNARLDEDVASARRAADYGGCCAGCACGCEPSTTRLLREVEAKRQILDRCWNYAGPNLATANDVIRYLALPYSDHRDYRQEWRP